MPFIKNIDPNEKFYTKVIYNYTKEQLIAYINHWDGTLRSELNLLTVTQLKTHVRSMQDRLGVKMTNKIDDAKQSAMDLKMQNRTQNQKIYNKKDQLDNQ